MMKFIETFDSMTMVEHLKKTAALLLLSSVGFGGNVEAAQKIETIDSYPTLEPRIVVAQCYTSNCPRQGKKQYEIDHTDDRILEVTPTGKANLIFQTTEAAYGLALDKSVRSLMWTEATPEGVVWRADLQTNEVEKLISSFDEPFFVSKDLNDELPSSFERSEEGKPTSQSLYYGYFLSGKKIMKIQLVDGQPTDIASEIVTLHKDYEPWGLALDELNEILYVGDSSGQMSLRVDLSSGRIANLSYKKSKAKDHNVNIASQSKASNK